MHRLAVILVLMICAAARAQTGVPATQPADQDPVHTELRALQVALESAVNRGDLDGLLAHLDDTVVFTGLNAHTVHGKQGIRDFFELTTQGPGRRIDSLHLDFIPDQLAVFYGPDVAITAGKARSRFALTQGPDFEMLARWTATLVRREGRWRVAALHYSGNLFDNPLVEAQRKQSWLTGGGAALALGVVGFAMGRRRRGSKRVRT